MASRHQLQLDPARVRLVIWGSPRAELADGTRIFAHSHAAAEMKASTFGWLCHEWPLSAVAITYARHQVEFEQWLPAGEIVGNFHAVVGDGYCPRYSPCFG